MSFFLGTEADAFNKILYQINVAERKVEQISKILDLRTLRGILFQAHDPIQDDLFVTVISIQCKICHSHALKSDGLRSRFLPIRCLFTYFSRPWRPIVYLLETCLNKGIRTYLF